jgi:hypothetical protein
MGIGFGGGIFAGKSTRYSPEFLPMNRHGYQLSTNQQSSEALELPIPGSKKTLKGRN